MSYNSTGDVNKKQQEDNRRKAEDNKKIDNEIALKKKEEVSNQGEIKNVSDRIRSSESSIRDWGTEVELLNNYKIQPWKRDIENFQRQIDQKQRDIDQFQQELEAKQKLIESETDAMEGEKRKLNDFEKTAKKLKDELFNLASQKKR